MAGLLALLPLLPLAADPLAAMPRLAQAGAQATVLSTPAPPPLPVSQAHGGRISINGQVQQARWQLEGGELWLPLEVLEGQLGVSRREAPGGTLIVEWFGERLVVPAERQRSLADEVAIPVAGLLQGLGVIAAVRDGELSLQLPPRTLLGIRSRDLDGGGRRVVFDLAAPSLLRSGEARLALAVSSTSQQRRQLEELGLEPRQDGDWLSLRADGQRLSLAAPWRLVLDLPGGGGGEARAEQARPTVDPRLAQLQEQGLVIERRIIPAGMQQVLLNRVRLDPRSVPLELRPLIRAEGMQGLSSLSQLARREQALIAINGGYFNRVNRLPLGALRSGGTWLSGPILNRGAMGWETGALPRFGRLSLVESLVDGNGQRWPLTSLNSGYAQRGLARYTAAWGRSYQPITGEEMAVRLRDGVVVQRIEAGELSGPVPLLPGDELLVARGGLQLPWQPGERLQLSSQPSDALGQSSQVIGGGPLLLQEGQLVLNGAAEGFSPAFLNQGAPRTVIASDGRQLWLLTLQGVDGPGPSLNETARLLQQLGARDALNLDGGSSTGLVLADVQTVKGRGVAAAVHNGLGLVPRGDLAASP